MGLLEICQRAKTAERELGRIKTTQKNEALCKIAQDLCMHTEEILKEKPEAKILLLTTFSDDEYIVKALKCGVKGYLLKQDYASILPSAPGSVHGADGVRNPDHIQTAGTFGAKECV